MAASEDDINDLRIRFTEVFETTEHPLFESMLSDLKNGRRLKSAIMTDLDEAAAHRARARDTDNPRLYIAQL